MEPRPGRAPAAARAPRPCARRRSSPRRSRPPRSRPPPTTLGAARRTSGNHADPKARSDRALRTRRRPSQRKARPTSTSKRGSRPAPRHRPTADRRERPAPRPHQTGGVSPRRPHAGPLAVDERLRLCRPEHERRLPSGDNGHRAAALGRSSHRWPSARGARMPSPFGVHPPAARRGRPGSSGRGRPRPAEAVARRPGRHRDRTFQSSLAPPHRASNWTRCRGATGVERSTIPTS